MSKAAAKTALLTLLQASAGKTLANAQSDYANDFIDIIANLIESGSIDTEVSGTLPDGPEAATGEGSITIP